ncbi:MAG: hypothetical protein MI754_16145 [Chromatiales bacterium]|nr:hypothetical protein [Chromatiales bacterium]
MSSEIVFHITSAAGIQLRIVQRLKQIGITTTKRTLKTDSADENRYLVLEVYGAEASDEAIWNQVKEIPGILALVKDESTVESEQPPPKSAAPAPPKEETIDPEAGDTEIRDRMLIFSLLSRYPGIDGRFNEIISGIPPENRNVRAYQLGRGFGVYLARQIKPKQAINNLSDAISHLLIPAISPMAGLQMDGNRLIMHSNQIDLRGRDHITETCDFLKGTIRGLLKAIELDNGLVDNNCCAADGGDNCLFLFNMD